MEKIVFECETITPIFMYGADATIPELRPASIKGVMRFWWRAIHGDLKLDELKE
ncbi:CRISPR-associated RAMP Cmr1 [hydrothermal vent metagenome]|uniref:CRISPR-associated RAMP Cmr1 n=1 Tax=hydrothermal vent metagenome TaxID=652676 RepID=A0A1W1EK50_9ZZZZ